VNLIVFIVWILLDEGPVYRMGVA